MRWPFSLHRVSPSAMRWRASTETHMAVQGGRALGALARAWSWRRRCAGRGASTEWDGGGWGAGRRRMGNATVVYGERDGGMW